MITEVLKAMMDAVVNQHRKTVEKWLESRNNGKGMECRVWLSPTLPNLIHEDYYADSTYVASAYTRLHVTDLEVSCTTEITFPPEAK